MINLNTYQRKIQEIDSVKVSGRVHKASGLVIESDGPPSSIGEICEVYPGGRPEPILSEVIGFHGKSVVSMPLYRTEGIKLGDRIVSRNLRPSIPVGDGLLGRIINADGQPLDDLPAVECPTMYPLNRKLLNPLSRQVIDTPLGTGVRAIDGLLSVGRGQRVGIFGGSGVGKSTLIGMMAKHTEADISVIALVGERGREVKAFVENELGEKGLGRCVVVVSTSDSSPLMRVRGALAATSVAEYFKDQGKNVLLVMDSVTRVAMAQREIGLAAGEPPSAKGYTTSVFPLLPRLFERAGNFEKGSVTGFYTVLVEGDDMNEPVADAVRGLLDGHFVLSRELAEGNHFPALHILESTSRLMGQLATPLQAERAAQVREILSTYRKAEDMINIGAYKNGSNPKIDRALAQIETINSYLRQRFDEHVTYEQAIQELHSSIQE